MAARLIHFGWDQCHRVAVLRSAGFEVKESHSLSTLWLDLKRDEQIDAVIVSEDDRQNAEEAADLVHQHHRLAPVIVFRGKVHSLDESKFDRVYTSVVSPEIWLAETDMLIQKSQIIRQESLKLQQKSILLQRDSQALRERSSRERARSRTEIERNKDAANFFGLRRSDK